jgi:hypothetical protein
MRETKHLLRRILSTVLVAVLLVLVMISYSNAEEFEVDLTKAKAGYNSSGGAFTAMADESGGVRIAYDASGSDDEKSTMHVRVSVTPEIGGVLTGATIVVRGTALTAGILARGSNGDVGFTHLGPLTPEDTTYELESRASTNADAKPGDEFKSFDNVTIVLLVPRVQGEVIVSKLILKTK